MHDDFDPLEQLAVGFALVGEELKSVAHPGGEAARRGMMHWAQVVFVKLGAASLLAYAAYFFLGCKIR